MKPNLIIIGLIGQAGAGKSTAAQYLTAERGFVEHAFATPIKEMLCAFFEPTGIDHAYLFEPTAKHLIIPGLGVSARRLMQTLGTDWGRAITPDIWVQHAALSLGLDDMPRSTPVHDRIVLSDVRFPNEAAWIKSLGGTLVRITRPAEPGHEAEGAATHESEQHAPTLQADLELNNTASKWHLHGMLYALTERLEREAEAADDKAASLISEQDC